MKVELSVYLMLSLQALIVTVFICICMHVKESNELSSGEVEITLQPACHVSVTENVIMSMLCRSNYLGRAGLQGSARALIPVTSAKFQGPFEAFSLNTAGPGPAI